MADFNDETPMDHNAYPESEEEDEEGVSRWEIQPVCRGEGDIFIGQCFFNREMFCEAVLDHALKSGRNLKQNRYDKDKIGFNCIGQNCKWRVYCGKKSDSDQWEIRRLNDTHSCVPNGECTMLKVHVLMRLFIHKIREEPRQFMPMKIKELVKAQWNITVSRAQCQFARLKALKLIEIEYDRQFGRLRDYGAEILHANPGSNVVIETLTNDDGLDVFNRFYVCVDVVRRAWLETCRKVIGVDGCFMKGKMKGQLLVAIGRDGNNCIYPIAWAVVQVEDTSNWTWFVKKMQDDFNLGDGDGFVLLSDIQKGLINAAKSELPKIEHKMCVRHIYANLKARFGKKPKMKLLIWQLAWSYTEVSYTANLHKVWAYDKDVYKYVIDSEPQHWCRCFYRIGSQCEDVDNNATESFNATIVKAREMPIVPMLEMIARQTTVRISKRFEKAAMHDGICTPYVQTIFTKEFPLAKQCKVWRSRNGLAEVLLDSISYDVRLETRSCSCRKWDIRGVPCEHAYAVILSMKGEVENYVEHWFRTDVWRRTYLDGIVPTRGAVFWPKGTGADVHRPPSPPQPGRKKNPNPKVQKKKKGVNESPTKKKEKQRIMHCGICGSANHNARHHKKKDPKKRRGNETEAGPSQVVSTQQDPSQGVCTQEESSQA